MISKMYCAYRIMLLSKKKREGCGKTKENITATIQNNKNNISLDAIRKTTLNDQQAGSPSLVLLSL